MQSSDTFQKVKKASRKLNMMEESVINAILKEIALAAIENVDVILAANVLDLDRMDPEDPKYDRLKLTKERIEGIASDIENIASLSSPLGKTLSEKTLDNGLNVSKISVPLGVIGIIYESRPNVTFDVFALCLKSGNACILKGGSDAKDSNSAIMNVIHAVLEKHDVDTNIVQLLPPDRAATKEMLEAVDYVDIIIPRGSQGLINFVRENSKVPVIETGAGICHTYYDQAADKTKALDIIVNAKTRRVSVCNALDCVLIHESRLEDLKDLGQRLAAKGTIVYADEQSFPYLKEEMAMDLLRKATDEHFGMEFLSNQMAVKTVKNLEEAIEHINLNSSMHSEAIVTEDEKAIDTFLKAVDAAAVYANASTAFTDGAQFGLGAEIGISTQKLHARGPMGLEELTSYKWIIKGSGQIRE